MTKTVGYPVHAVAKFVRWKNPYDAKFTTWPARSGATGDEGGHGPFGTAFHALRGELCPQCFPGRDFRAADDVEPEELTNVNELQVAA